jgi:hypothetical protein
VERSLIRLDVTARNAPKSLSKSSGAEKSAKRSASGLQI